MAGRFEGKQALVLGVANKRSLAWAIARRLHDEGAELAFTFQGERIEKGVRELAESIGAKLVTPCDVRSDDDVARVLSETGEAFGGGLDLLVHSVAFAATEDLEGRFIDTPRDRFWMAIDISAYSLVACAKAAEPLMQARGGGSIVTMTYLGGIRAVPHYNVMGVAKATLDAERPLSGLGSRPERHRVERGLGRPGPYALGALNRRFHDDGGDVRATGAASSPYRRGRRRRRRSLPAVGRCGERDGDDAVRRLRLSRDGHVARSGARFPFAPRPASLYALKRC